MEMPMKWDYFHVIEDEVVVLKEKMIEDALSVISQ